MLENVLVRSSKKEMFSFVLLALEEVVETEEENAVTNPLPRAAWREVFLNAATEHKKIIAVLPKIMMLVRK